MIKINHAKNLKFLVIGDLMVDSYLSGKCNRISPEAPVQIVDLNKQRNVLGGAGNVVKNLTTLGAKVDVLSVIGGCQNSLLLKKLLADEHISSEYLIVEEKRITPKKTRLISDNQQIVRFDSESSNPVDSITEEKIQHLVDEIINQYDGLLLSDYGKGLLTENLTKKIIAKANKADIKVFVDPKGSNYQKYYGAYTATPNLKEASQAVGFDILNEETLYDALKIFHSEFHFQYPLVTMSEKGIALFEKMKLETFPTTSREVYDVTGAGDTVLAALAFAICNENDIQLSINFANLAAGIVVGKFGAATATIDEIIEYESSIKKSDSRVLIKNFQEIQRIVEEKRKLDSKIVFTNGCFDIIHTGHVSYLEQAKTYGDTLIVGINSDRSVRSLKGDERPINSEADRAYILASIKAVDFVVVFDDDTPLELIDIIKPNILVKGADYTNKKVVGSDIADEVIFCDFIDGKSSTSIIKKIKNEKNN